MTPLIHLTGITKTLKGQGEPRTILSGVDLILHSGRSSAILGRSGSGKTTLLSLLGLFDRADGGRYLLGEQDITLVVDVLRDATSRGCGLVLVTHDRDHARKVDDVVELHQGRFA